MANSVRMIHDGRTVVFDRDRFFTARDPRHQRPGADATHDDDLVVTVEPGGQRLKIDCASALRLASALTEGVARQMARGR
ncbi:MAG TPA: hypothetical protein VGP82_17775 [Ktedonobacterales bacterium]|jgi:hypothetical protein|nr:hypothetical protein [Ktedonobacterales bacterium]